MGEGTTKREYQDVGNIDAHLAGYHRVSCKRLAREWSVAIRD